MATSPTPLISVVIPSHNRAAFLRDAVESCSASVVSKEILIVDDASTDITDSLLVATKAARWLHQPNRRGAAAARNTGLRAARGKYVAFLDSDDLFVAGSLDWRVEYLESHQECDAVAGSLAQIIDADGNTLPLPKDALEGFPSLVSPLSLGQFRHWVPPFGLCLSVFRKAFVTRLGFLDETLRVSEDREYFLRAMQDGRFEYQDRPTLIYRVHGGNQSLKKQSVFSLSPRARAEILLVDRSYGVTSL